MGLQALYDRHVLPHLIGCACAQPKIMQRRAKLVPKAEGRVLELGIGGGLNLRFYDPARVSGVVGVDPSPELRAKADAAERPPGLAVELVEGRAEALPFEAASFDTVVCTFTLCSVHAPFEALAQARRVLRPGGRLLFCEHGLAPDADVARWQRRLDPSWKRLFGGCHLSRPVGATLDAAGFRCDEIEARYMPGAPRFAGWVEWGAARPA